SVPPQTWKKPWVVHCKAVGSGEHALQYLARYVFRVALSNSRILALENGAVTFSYKDAETKVNKTSRLPAEEFIRRKGSPLRSGWQASNARSRGLALTPLPKGMGRSRGPLLGVVRRLGGRSGPPRDFSPGFGNLSEMETPLSRL
ncbi:MAG: transposase, partial [Gammaproteobacteria bacterium]|nr:transposase [Gammaproteobacteria bacterium]